MLPAAAAAGWGAWVAWGWLGGLLAADHASASASEGVWEIADGLIQLASTHSNTPEKREAAGGVGCDGAGSLAKKNAKGGALRPLGSLGFV